MRDLPLVPFPGSRGRLVLPIPAGHGVDSMTIDGVPIAAGRATLEQGRLFLGEVDSSAAVTVSVRGFSSLV